MSRKRITVEGWITEALQDADKGQPCTMLSLLYVKGIGTEEVHSKEISGPQNFKGLADFFVNKACNYSQDMTGVSTFRLIAFYGKQEPQASFTFTTYEGNLTAGETAPWSKHENSPSGLLAQLMKHNEAIMQGYGMMTQGMLTMLIQRDQEHQKEKAEMHLVMRDVLLNLRKESHQMALEQLRFQRESEERLMIGRMVPGALNYLTGREVVPVSHVDTQIVEAIGMKIGPQELQLLVATGKLSQEEALVLAQRFTQVREEAEKRKKALATIPSEESNGIGNGKPEAS